jgi:hypothetical protein
MNTGSQEYYQPTNYKMVMADLMSSNWKKDKKKTPVLGNVCSSYFTCITQYHQINHKILRSPPLGTQNMRKMSKKDHAH